MTKLYQLGRLIGMGSRMAFFEIKGYKHLGVKILFAAETVLHRRDLQKEFNKGYVLRKLGISVPKHVGIVDVLIPDDIITKIKESNVFHTEREFMIDILKEHRNDVWPGLVVELIEGDIRYVNKDEVAQMYIEEMHKIRSHGILVGDSEENHNVLWSKKKKKLYFIDYESWVFPYNLHKLLPKTTLMERIFGID